ncbi:ABC transporter substrate-binding protein [Bradyrhizobium guangdongense]|uniref:ABC transporter substrate-binding protein n=1 Tax=Bradyrhizobium guangdongense TaxID=1325090 RepID=UPI001129259B|nr:ABC transporter substrate-binding protein [Bradyrhizobium guangdongense]TPQ32810.1 ABC transporter substrate-binding protein [Bradyrhizobium guangdongense]
MRRREFTAGLLLAAAMRPVYAQRQDAPRRIGILSPGRAEPADPTFNMVNAFLKGLSELGYMEGKNLVVERQFANGNSDRLRELSVELAARKPEIIVTISTTAARPARQATSTIPILAIGMADPVADELVASLARPGGNVTGTTFLGPELVAKRLQLLKEVVPGLSRVAALLHPNAYSERTMAGIRSEMETAARTLGLQLQLVPAANPDQIAGAFEAMTSAHAQALIVMPSPMLFGEYRRIAGIAASNGLPAMGAAREFADFGGLMAYGANQSDLARQTAAHADRILKGAKPAELPVEQPIKFELVINLKTARELGLTVSRAFLLVADDVIE